MTYAARKMMKFEFKTTADLIKRDAAGALCGFAVEHSSGAKVLGLSWAQASLLAEKNNGQDALLACVLANPVREMVAA